MHAADAYVAAKGDPERCRELFRKAHPEAEVTDILQVCKYWAKVLPARGGRINSTGPRGRRLKVPDSVVRQAVKLVLRGVRTRKGVYFCSNWEEVNCCLFARPCVSAAPPLIPVVSVSGHILPPLAPPTGMHLHARAGSAVCRLQH